MRKGQVFKKSLEGGHFCDTDGIERLMKHNGVKKKKWNDRISKYLSHYLLTKNNWFYSQSESREFIAVLRTNELCEGERKWAKERERARTKDAEVAKKEKKSPSLTPREIPSNSTPLTEATGHQLYTPKLAHSSTKKPASIRPITPPPYIHTQPQRDL